LHKLIQFHINFILKFRFVNIFFNFTLISIFSFGILGCSGNKGFMLSSDSPLFDVTGNPEIEPSQKTMSVNNEFLFVGTKGQAPYSFSILSGQGKIQSETGLFKASSKPGNVVLQVTDNQGLTSTADIKVNAAMSVEEQELVIDKNSEYNFNPTGGVPPYTFTILSGRGSIDASTGKYIAPNIPGSSAIQIKDAFGNSVIKVIMVSDGIILNPSSATIAKNSQITFNSYGGIPPYSYSLLSGSQGTLNSITGLYTAPSGEGRATIKVVDSLGHTTQAEIKVTNDISFIVGSIVLAAGNSIDLLSLIEGGTPPIIFSLPTTPGTLGTLNSSTYTAPSLPGVYDVNVSDSASPEAQHASLKVIVNSVLAVFPQLYQLPVNSQKLFTALGGVGPYTYSIQSGGGTISNTGLFNSPAENGQSIILIKDARNNTATAQVIIGDAINISPITISLVNGDSTTFTASGGVPPYKYSIVSGQGSMNPTTGVYVAPNLSAVETIRVEDAIGGRSDATVTVLPKLSLGSTAYLLKGATKTFSAVGGAPPYKYYLKTGLGSIVENSGEYSAPNQIGNAVIKVVDSLSNTVDLNINLYEILTISPLVYSLSKDETLTFSANGGVPPYTYSLRSGVGTLSPLGAYVSSNAGNAVVRVIDSINNTMDATITVNVPVSINPSQLITSLNKKSTFIASGGVSPYTFRVKSGLGSIDAQTGEYTAPNQEGSAVIAVTDASSFSDEALVSIHTAMSISPENPTIISGDSVNFLVNGGVPPYQYAVVTGGGSFVDSTYTSPKNFSGGSVTVRATDSIGSSITTLVTYKPVLVSITTPTLLEYVNSNNKASFSVAGTCSENGRPVHVAASGGLTSNPTCILGSWSTTLDFTNLPDGSVSISADHSSQYSVNALTSIVFISKDIILPTVSIWSPTLNSLFINEVTVSGTCTKTGVVTLSAGAGILSNTQCDGSTYSGILDIKAGSQGNLEITVTHGDGKGNFNSDKVSINIIRDSIAPLISLFEVTNGAYTSNTTYQLNLTATGDPVLYCLLENSSNLSSCVWNATPLPTSLEVDSTNNAKVLSIWLKDSAGNISTKVDSNSVTLNTTIPQKPSLIIFNPTTTPSNIINPTFTITSSNLVNDDSVELFLDSSCSASSKGSSSTFSNNSINVTSSSLSEGNYVFYAKTTNNAGTKSACSAGSATYNVDLTAPSVTNVTGSGNGPSVPLYFKSGGTLTVSIQFSEVVYVNGTPTLDLNTGRVGAKASYLSGSETNTLVFSYTVTSGDNSSDLTYTNTTSLNLNSGTIRDFAGNNVTLTLPAVAGTGSLSANQQIILDTVVPVAPSSVVDGQWMNSLSTTTSITFTAGTDVGGSLVAKQQVQVIKSSDSSVVKSWSDLTSTATSASVSGLSLTEATAYKVQLKAIDNAGNESTVVTSDGWTTDITGPAAIVTLNLGTVPNSVTNSPPINWGTNSTDSVSGVAYYQVQVYKASDNSVISTYATNSPFTITSSVTGLSLTNTLAYYVKVRALDNAGNIGSEAQSSSWTVAAASCAATTSSNCTLAATSHGGTSGSCAANYAGSCSFSCSLGNWSQSSNSCVYSCPGPSPTCNGSSPTYAGGSCNQLLSNGVSASGIYWIKPNANGALQVYCEQSFDTGGYTLIADLARTNTLLWPNFSDTTGNLSNGQKLSDANINAIWARAEMEKRLLIRCVGGGTWGSAVANAWYGGSFTSGYRSNCGFSYGATIYGYGSSWYQQNGGGGCLHGSYTNMSGQGTGVACTGDIQFLIK
jgi:hypothetical protein